MIDGLFTFAARAISASSLVEMWHNTSLVPCFIAISNAVMLDFMHALRLRMFSCSVNGMSCPYFSIAAVRLALIVASSSQWTSIGFSFISNNLSRDVPLSTSMFPVDDPMKTFTPGMSSALIPAFASPSRTNEHIMSALSFVAPIWKPIFVNARPVARSILPFKVSAVIVAGFVFGMSNTVVTPPATAAFDSVSMSALWVKPGSRKCT